jgi:release factor glutamine methyltransferase
VSTEVAALEAEGAARLSRVADDPRAEAQILLAAALRKPRAWLIAHAEDPVLDCEATDRYEAYLTRRALGEPVAYVLGVREFWSLPLEVGPAVLVPRPETELVVERVLQSVPGLRVRVPHGAPTADTSASGNPNPQAWHRLPRLLDLGTGSGAIALAIASERPDCTVLGVDREAAALEVARRNALRLRLRNVQFVQGDWYSACPPGERYALIASNPPYVAEGDPRLAPEVRRFEPHAALYSGPTGLEAFAAIVGGAPARLVPGGWLVLEHGAGQADCVRRLLGSHGFVEITSWTDLAGIERVTEGRMPS